MAFDQLERLTGVERRLQDQGATVGERRRQGVGGAVGPEQRDRDPDAVTAAQAHALADGEAVLDHGVLLERHRLWPGGRSRCVEHERIVGG